MFKKRYHSFPEGEITHADKPDFIINSNRKIGVEVTQIFKDQHRQSVSFTIIWYGHHCSKIKTGAQHSIANPAVAGAGDRADLFSFWIPNVRDYCTLVLHRKQRKVIPKGSLWDGAAKLQDPEASGLFPALRQCVNVVPHLN